MAAYQLFTANEAAEYVKNLGLLTSNNRPLISEEIGDVI